MKFRIHKLSFLLTCLGILATAASSQTSGPITWETIVGNDGEFSISVPQPLVVYQDNRLKRTNVVGGAGGAGFDLSFNNSSVNHAAIKRHWLLRFRAGSHAAFDIGKSRVDVYTHEGQKTYRIKIVLATKKASYSLSISAPTAGNEVLRSLLASIRLNDQYVFKDLKSPRPVSLSSISAKDLKTSDLAVAALKRKQTDPVRSAAAPVDYVPTESEIVYSRPVLVVLTKAARYTDEARSNNVTGSVELLIQLKANGNVGNILVLKGLPFGLTEEAIRAASETKFVPAEIDGKPADSEVTREYTFHIY